MMRQNRTGEPPEDGPRPFSSADSTEQRLRAEAALSREELQETIAELVRRTDLRSALRASTRRRSTRCRYRLQRARGRIGANRTTAVLVGVTVTACCCAAALALIRGRSPCRR